MNTLKRKNSFSLFILGVTLLIAAAWVGLYVIASAKQKVKAVVEATTKYRQLAEQVDYVTHYDKLTHWQREKWEVDTFFTHPRELRRVKSFRRETQECYDLGFAAGEMPIAPATMASRFCSGHYLIKT